MRFNPATLFALAATITQLATAIPMNGAGELEMQRVPLDPPDQPEQPEQPEQGHQFNWRDRDAEATYVSKCKITNTANIL